MRFKSFAFSLSTMLALKSFITSVPVAQYCEFCILQLWLHNKMNRTHCSLTLTNTCALYCVASDSNDPVWTSLIFFKDKCCVSPSVQSVGMIIVLNSWNGKVSSSYLLPPLPKRGKKKYPQLSDEKKCIQDQGISLVLKRAALVIFWPVCRRLGLERHSQIHTGSWPDLWCLVWVWSPDSPPKSRAIASLTSRAGSPAADSRAETAAAATVKRSCCWGQLPRRAPAALQQLKWVVLCNSNVDVPEICLWPGGTSMVGKRLGMW